MIKKSIKVMHKECPRMTGKAEFGRTMVEILGALVIIGILSIAGLVMYVYLMGVHRENETLDVIDKVAVGTYTSRDKGEEVAGEGNRLLASVISSGIEQVDEYTLTTALQTQVSAYRLGEDEYEVHLKNVSYGVCEKVLNGTADYISAYLNRSTGEGVYVGDSEEEKEAFCAKVDKLKREVPYIDVQENNPEANMILCYSLNDEGCNIPSTPPPQPTEEPCGLIAHGEQYNDCGLCNNGNWVMGEPIENTCYNCGPDTEYRKVLREGSFCGDRCHICDASGACVLKDPALPEVCGEVCCPSGECNDARDGCKKACEGGCNACQYCDTNEGECKPDYTKNDTPIDDCHICFEGSITAVDDGDNPQADGKCCVGGELKYDATHCPEPSFPCVYGEENYEDGEAVNDCGICNRGTVTVDTSKYFAHCQCNTDTDYKKANCSCPDELYETCPSYLTSVGSFDRGDGVQCHTCRCPAGTTAYKKDKKPWKLNNESDVQDEIGYCCGYQKPLPGEKLGECAYCDTDITCNPENLGSDCPENSFCFNSGDEYGWHCHAKSLIENISSSAYAYGVRTGSELSLMTAWTSRQRKIAANVCAALGKSPTCISSSYYSWSSDGECKKLEDGYRTTYDDSKCNNQNVEFSGIERNGGMIYCE